MERREIRVSAALTGHSALPGLAQVAEVRTEVVRVAAGGLGTRVRSLVTGRGPRRASPQRLLALSRGHRGIEDRLSHVADGGCGEDRHVPQSRAAGTLPSPWRAAALDLLRGEARPWTKATPLTARPERVNGRPSAVRAALEELCKGPWGVARRLTADNPFAIVTPPRLFMKPSFTSLGRSERVEKEAPPMRRPTRTPGTWSGRSSAFAPWRSPAAAAAILVVAALLGVPLAWTPGAADAAQTPAAAIECPITIGAAVHLTGSVATYDAPPVQGAELAVKEINDRGGVLGCELRLIKTDGASDIAKVGDAAVAAVQEGAQVLIAPCDFDYGAPVSQVAQENGIVGISECASSPLYNSHVLGDMQFTMSNWANANAAASAEHACVTKGWKRGVAVIDSFTSFTELLGEYWVDAYQYHGCTVVETLAYTKGEMTFAAQTQRLQELAGQYDVILITADMPDVSVIIRSLRSAGITAPIVGAGNMDTGEFFKAVGPEAGDEIYVTSLYWMGPETGPDMERFLQAFQEMYGKPADSGLYVMGYNLVNVLAQAIEIAGTVDGPALADAMENREFKIVGGTMSWTDAENGHQPTAPQFMVVMRQGELVYEGPVQATYVPTAEEAQAPQ